MWADDSAARVTWLDRPAEISTPVHSGGELAVHSQGQRATPENRSQADQPWGRGRWKYTLGLWTFRACEPPRTSPGPPGRDKKEAPRRSHRREEGRKEGGGVTPRQSRSGRS